MRLLPRRTEGDPRGWKTSTESRNQSAPRPELSLWITIFCRGGGASGDEARQKRRAAERRGYHVLRHVTDGTQAGRPAPWQTCHRPGDVRAHSGTSSCLLDLRLTLSSPTSMALGANTSLMPRSKLLALVSSLMGAVCSSLSAWTRRGAQQTLTPQGKELATSCAEGQAALLGMWMCPAGPVPNMCS